MGDSIIDLSHKLSENMPVFPGCKPPKITEIANCREDGFYENHIALLTHIGTHIDAPAHVLPEGKTLDKYPIDSFVGKAVCLDFRNEKMISCERIQEKLSKFIDYEFILFNTAWDKFWGDLKYFEHFPLLDELASSFIAGLKLKGIGIDAISYDAIESSQLPNHKLLMSQGMFMIENMQNLDSLAGKTFHFSCAPIIFEKADGAPTRAYATL